MLHLGDHQLELCNHRLGARGTLLGVAPGRLLGQQRGPEGGDVVGGGSGSGGHARDLSTARAASGTRNASRSNFWRQPAACGRHVCCGFRQSMPSVQRHQELALWRHEDLTPSCFFVRSIATVSLPRPVDRRGVARSCHQAWPHRGHRRSRRAACLTAASTAPAWSRSGSPSGGCALRRRCRLEQPAAALLAQSVAVAANGQHVAVVQEAIEDCGRDHRVDEHRAPFAHGPVRGDQHGAA